MYDSGNADERQGVMCNTAVAGTPGDASSFIFSVWVKETKKMSVHKSLWPHLELCLHWALLSENVVAVSYRVRNLKNLYVGLKQLFHLEKKTNKRVVPYEHSPCHQNYYAKKIP